MIEYKSDHPLDNQIQTLNLLRQLRFSRFSLGFFSLDSGDRKVHNFNEKIMFDFVRYLCQSSRGLLACGGASPFIEETLAMLSLKRIA